MEYVDYMRDYSLWLRSEDNLVTYDTPEDIRLFSETKSASTMDNHNYLKTVSMLQLSFISVRINHEKTGELVRNLTH